MTSVGGKEEKVNRIQPPLLVFFSPSLYERGAWVRVYDTTVHAWNASLFELFVADCGRYIKVDDCTMDKGRLVFARILVSTTSLEVLNLKFVVVIDGCKFTFKLVEEWGCSLGEDAFLTEEDTHLLSEQKEEGSELFADIGLEQDNGDVDALLHDIQKDWNLQDNDVKATDVVHLVDDDGADVGSETNQKR